MNKHLFVKEVSPSDNEFTSFIESKNENRKCAKTLEDSMDKHYSGYSLDTRAVILDALEKFTPDRIAYIFAVRIHDNDGFDKRISDANEKWSKELLAGIPDMYKNKEDSPIGADLRCYLSSAHKGLIDMTMSDFRRIFPDVKLVREDNPLTANLEVKPYGAAFEDNDNEFDVDIIELDNAFISFEMELPPSSVMYEFLQRVPDFSDAYPNESVNEFMVDRITNPKIKQDDVLNRSYIRAYEDGSLEYICLGHTIPLNESETKSLENVLNTFTKEHYKATLPQTVLWALNGVAPKDISDKIKQNKQSEREDII